VENERSADYRVLPEPELLPLLEPLERVPLPEDEGVDDPDPVEPAEHVPPRTRTDCTFSVWFEADMLALLPIPLLLEELPELEPIALLLDPVFEAPADELPGVDALLPLPEEADGELAPEPDVLVEPDAPVDGAMVISTRLPTSPARFTRDALGAAITMYVSVPPEAEVPACVSE